MSLARARLPSAPALGALTLATLALGCSDIETPAQLVGETLPVVNGERSVAADDGVVLIGNKGGAACTASVIAPNVVLTALHCVADFKQDSGFVCRQDGTIDPTSPLDGKLSGTLEPSKFEVRVGVDYHSSVDAHGAKIFSTGSTNICSNDLAVMILDTDLDAPIVSMRFGRSVQKGELVRAVGYGQTETDGTMGRFVRHDIRILDVGADLISEGSKTAVKNTLVVGEGPCHGDSGGPARSEETDAILGVYSILNASNCRSPGVRNVYTQVSPFETLIRKALTEAGHEPLLEPDPNGGGEGGAAGADAGGAPGAAGAGTEPEVGGSGGVPDGSGGSSKGGSGGSSAKGGSGGTDNGSGGSGDEPGAGATAGASGSKGSGSRRDGSCACRTAPEPERQAPIGMIGGLIAAVGLVVRRRRA